jgi:hypothetical protein
MRVKIAAVGVLGALTAAVAPAQGAWEYFGQQNQIVEDLASDGIYLYSWSFTPDFSTTAVHRRRIADMDSSWSPVGLDNLTISL